MDEKQLTQLKEVMGNVFDQMMQEKLAPFVGDLTAQKTKEIVEKLRAERNVFGHDRTGLTEKQKKDFAEVVKAAALKLNIDTKANEALLEEQDNRGGILVSREVANAITRIAASVGVVMSQAAKWDLTTDELGIPSYTGSFLEGEYLGVDAGGSLTALTFGAANLIVKKWQLAFVVGNDLLVDASVNLADWLLALGGEALANMVDKQTFIGTGSPFIGLQTNADVATWTMPTGGTGFDKFNPIADASDVIGQLEESVLDGAAFYFHRTVWAKIRATKDGAGNYILPFGGVASPAVLQNNPTGGGVKPAGEILGFPVFTVRHLPAFSATGTSKLFGVFGNMKAQAYGDKGEMRVSQFESGNFSGEIALKDQRALVYKHRHALVTALAAAFVNIKTSAS
ncbi:phage major capsid protein [Candidatus Kaiserbacteria bacterium]|nr:phage major capsid protein [Candidatus Kaiserbacteria bacterium]